MGEVCTALSNAMVEAGFCAYALPMDLNKPRGVITVGTTGLVVLERNTASVVHLFDSDGDGVADSKRTLATADRLNHGLALHDGFIYASSDTIVYRWPYSGDTFDEIGEEEIVVNNINADGQGGAPQGHTTRTLAFDDLGRLYISVGSNGNVDADSYRSRIRRFDLFADGAVFPFDFQTGEVFADGLRNEVGLAFDVHGVLWGVENGADNLFRSDIGGDIHQDNPAEELNRFREEDAGKHWGYPYCWTEFSLPTAIGEGRGTAWAWPSFLESGEITDEQCQSDFEAPIVAMQGHSAPLGIVFYQYSDQRPEECGSVAFPKRYDGYAFIAHHGSWNRDIPTGYKVVYVPFDESGDAMGEPVDLLAHEPPNAQWEDGFRPVDVDFDECGRLIVTSDGTGSRGSKIVRIQYDAEPSPGPIDTVATPQPTVVGASSPPTGTESNTNAPSSPTTDPCPCLPSSDPNPGSSEIPSVAVIVKLWASVASVFLLSIMMVY